MCKSADRFRAVGAPYALQWRVTGGEHVLLEYLWKAAYAFHPAGTRQAESWVSQRLLWLLSGQVSQVAAGMRRSATRRGLSDDKRQPVDECADYLLNHKAYLRYDEYLAAGLPIASGLIEGTGRYLVNDRLDITGARWSVRGAEAVLRLRSLRGSGDFDAYWAFHLDREQERNHRQHYAGEVPATPPASLAERPSRPPLRLVN